MWTDERVVTLKTLWADGLSAREIAGQLGGLTRNAVIGKVYRLGLSGSGGGASQPRRVRTARVARPPRPRSARPKPQPPTPAAPRVVAPVAEVPEGPGLVASVLQLRAHVCRWPIGDPKSADFSFCGHPAQNGGPYCPGHHQRAHQPGKLVPLSQDRTLRRLLAA